MYLSFKILFKEIDVKCEMQNIIVLLDTRSRYKFKETS